MIYGVTIDGTEHRLELSLANGKWYGTLAGREFQLDAVLVQPNVLSVVMEGKSYEIRREWLESELRIWIGDQVYAADVRDPRSFRGRKKRADDSRGAQKLIAPMPGKVVKTLVEEGSAVEKGQGIMVVEAMKMQNEIRSPKSGIVVKLAVAEGAAVNAGDILAIVE
jgi:biotin carboxyl carrier protein